MKKETLKEAAVIRYGSDQYLWAKQRDGFVEGAKWQQERICIDIEQKWNEYRGITNNEDAWSFKDWLVKEFKKPTQWYNEEQTTERMNIIGQNGNDGTHYDNK